jgi:hypothetical protein
MTLDLRAARAIAALREPDASLARVSNTVRQSIADVIEEQRAEIDGFRVVKVIDDFFRVSFAAEREANDPDRT